MSRKKCGCGVSKLALVLIIIGGINWGLVGLGMLMGSDWNLVNMIFGSWPMIEGIVYLLVGISAVVSIFGCKCNKCKDCMVQAPASSAGMQGPKM